MTDPSDPPPLRLRRPERQQVTPVPLYLDPLGISFFRLQQRHSIPHPSSLTPTPSPLTPRTLMRCCPTTTWRG